MTLPNKYNWLIRLIFIIDRFELSSHYISYWKQDVAAYKITFLPKFKVEYNNSFIQNKCVPRNLKMSTDSTERNMSEDGVPVDDVVSSSVSLFVIK